MSYILMNFLIYLYTGVKDDIQPLKIYNNFFFRQSKCNASDFLWLFFFRVLGP